jgi:hypothetical protein
MPTVVDCALLVFTPIQYQRPMALFDLIFAKAVHVENGET